MSTPAVVVEIKETGNSRAALRLAAQEARYRDAMLIAVMAYGGNPALGTPAGRPMAAPLTAAADRVAAEWAAVPRPCCPAPRASTCCARRPVPSSSCRTQKRPDARRRPQHMGHSAASTTC